MEVYLKDETVWLNRQKMAELFDKDRRTITRHSKRGEFIICNRKKQRFIL